MSDGKKRRLTRRKKNSRNVLAGMQPRPVANLDRGRRRKNVDAALQKSDPAADTSTLGRFPNYFFFGQVKKRRASENHSHVFRNRLLFILLCVVLALYVVIDLVRG